PVPQGRAPRGGRSERGELPPEGARLRDVYAFVHASELRQGGQRGRRVQGRGAHCDFAQARRGEAQDDQGPSERGSEDGGRAQIRRAPRQGTPDHRCTESRADSDWSRHGFFLVRGGSVFDVRSPPQWLVRSAPEEGELWIL